jgi:hypothetical protein
LRTRGQDRESEARSRNQDSNALVHQVASIGFNEARSDHLDRSGID